MENTAETISESIMLQREQILDREKKMFLSKHNLPIDKDELREKGFILLQDIYTNYNNVNPTQTSERFKFTLCRIVDKYELAVSYDLNIKSENPLNNLYFTKQ